MNRDEAVKARLAELKAQIGKDTNLPEDLLPEDLLDVVAGAAAVYPSHSNSPPPTESSR